ncbi:hypothetical protein ACIQGZ_12295 [Streptomyces sp. NPDC092296]|uniref:hypothetical protein n=1 Tax=Streptomyces sp. NPDC092296 TaxID=3366012 RepID=UPI0037FCEE9F
MSGTPMPDESAARGSGLPASGAGPVRCPACRREHRYEPPRLPCPCGASLSVPLLRGGVPVQVRFRSWEDSWLSMRCPRCGRSDQWPQPEFTCNCGATVRLPVDGSPVLHPPAAPPGSAPPGTAPPGTALPPTGPAPAASGSAAAGPAAARPRFRAVPVRTSHDAVATAARYLEWLGLGSRELSQGQERDGIRLLGDRLVAQVDIWPEPADLRSVECLWLSTLHAEESVAVMFTLAGYAPDAVVRGEQLLVALFVLDRTGMPQPVNGAARLLVRTGSPS